MCTQLVIFINIINCADMGRAWLLLCTGFIYFFLVFFFRWPDPNFQSARHWVMQPVMFSPLDIHCTAVETLINRKCYIYFFFVVRKIYFLLVLPKVQYHISHGMCWLNSFHFWNVTNKIALTLQVYFARSDCHWFICNFESISCGFWKLKWIL